MHSPVQFGVSTDCFPWNSLNVYSTTGQYQLISELTQNGNVSTVTRLGFASISETEATSDKKRVSGGAKAVSRSVTRCHQVAFNGSSKPHPLISAPYVARVLYSYTYVGPDNVCPSSEGNELTSLRHLYIIDQPLRLLYVSGTPELWLTCVHPRCRMSDCEVAETNEILWKVWDNHKHVRQSQPHKHGNPSSSL